jgi:DNA-nicking Smr family endonuclease
MTPKIKDDKPMPDIDADAVLFRDSMSDVRPLQQAPQAPSPKKVKPRARFSRKEREDVLREAMEGEYDPRDIHSEDSLRFQRQIVGKRTMRKLIRGSFAVQSEIDLHGMTGEEAHTALRQFISDACLRGFTCVRIVHGKGLGSGERGPILKRKVATLLRRFKPVLAYSSARQVDGGTGAVYVLLDRQQSF